ncbi:HdeD family acid-resistance protein [Embleya sp. NPDC020630]|uniref:HdeD family acid-resistance protein n=1 Tax=Embleya sp. NPDC020630 TaxID=3363979 RepID=UPI0037AA72A3
MESTKGVTGPSAEPGVGRHRRSGKGFGFGLLVVLGVVLMLGGVVGLIYTGLATLTTMVLFGWLLLIGGVVGFVQAIQARKENAFWLVVAVSALNIAAGVVLLRRPEVGAQALTLFVALLLLGAGMFRIVGGVASMSAKMIWTIVVGVVDLVLGLLVLAEWPSSSRYVIGTFISLALLFDGLSLVSLGLTGRRIVGMVRDAEVPEPTRPTEWTAEKPPTREGTYKGPDAMTKQPTEDQ